MSRKPSNSNEVCRPLTVSGRHTLVLLVAFGATASEGDAGRSVAVGVRLVGAGDVNTEVRGPGLDLGLGAPAGCAVSERSAELLFREPCGR